MVLVVECEPSSGSILRLLAVLEVLIDDDGELVFPVDLFRLELLEHVQLNEDDPSRFSACLASRI